MILATRSQLYNLANDLQLLTGIFNVIIVLLTEKGNENDVQIQHYNTMNSQRSKVRWVCYSHVHLPDFTPLLMTL